MELTILEFLAQTINKEKSTKQGYLSPRWLCLRQDIKDECLAEAQQMFEEWRDDELRAKTERERIWENQSIN